MNKWEKSKPVQSYLRDNPLSTGTENVVYRQLNSNPDRESLQQEKKSMVPENTLHYPRDRRYSSPNELQQVLVFVAELNRITASTARQVTLSS